MTRVLHTARISHVDSVMFASGINRIRKMINFELGIEIEKGVLCPTLVTRGKTSFSTSLPSSKVTFFRIIIVITV